MLSVDDRNLLIALKKRRGRIGMETLAKESKLDIGKVMMLSQSLREKGLVDIVKQRKMVASLTREGSLYAKSKLPERRLVEALIKLGGKATLADCVRRGLIRSGECAIAVGWMGKKGWGQTKRVKGKRVLVSAEKPKEGADERLLDMLSKRARVVDELPRGMREATVTLKRRGIVRWRGITTVEIGLTAKGAKAIRKRVPVVKEVTSLTPDLIRTGKWKEIKLKRYDVTIPPPAVYPGKKHPYLEFLERVRRILLEMGFVEADSPYVEMEFWNFDALFQAQDHPAREIHSSYKIKYPRVGRLVDDDLVRRVRSVHERGWKTGSTGWRYKWSFDIARSLVLRTQGTAVSVRYLSEHQEPPIKMFAIARVFRPEALDATHSMEFYHCEGIVMDRGANFRHLLGFLKTFANLLGFERVKFRPGYFPFTEPSCESMVYHPKLGWVEILGGGMFRPEVTAPLGVKYPVLAWGIGIGRLAMASLGIDDIRDLFTGDLEALRRA